MEEAAALARESGDMVVTSFVLCNLGSVALAAGDRERAQAASLEALELHRKSPPELQRANTLGTALATLGVVALFQGRLCEARERLTESLSLALQSRDLPTLPPQLTRFAALAAGEGDFRRAAFLLGAADALCERTDFEFGLEPLESDLHERTESEARTNLTQEEFVKAREEGRKVAPEEAAAVALERSAPRQA